MRLLLTVLMMFSLLIVQAQKSNNDQQVTSHTFVFRFTPGDSIFYNNILGNGEELQRIASIIKENWSDIESGKIKMLVEGYCSSGVDREMNHQLAVIRSKRVKSHFIMKEECKEEYFITTNHTASYKGEADVELVIVNIPQKQNVGARIMDTAVEPVVEQKPLVAEEPTPVVEQPEQLESVQLKQPDSNGEKVAQSDPRSDNGIQKKGIWSLRTNLLYRLANMVNLGIEWKPSTHFGMLLNAGWSGTEWKNGDRKLRLWMVSPEVRWYIDNKSRWFLGMEGHAGKFNIKLSETGYQGSFAGCGLTGGYRARLSRYFDVDFSLGAGYIYTEYDEYYRENGESVKKNETRIKKNIIGPTQVGVSLIWKLK